jgi:hypothetical protein
MEVVFVLYVNIVLEISNSSYDKEVRVDQEARVLRNKEKRKN